MRGSGDRGTRDGFGAGREDRAAMRKATGKLGERWGLQWRERTQKVGSAAEIGVPGPRPRV